MERRRSTLLRWLRNPGTGNAAKGRRGTKQMGQRSAAGFAGKRRAKCGFVFLVKHQGSRGNRVGPVLLGE